MKRNKTLAVVAGFALAGSLAACGGDDGDGSAGDGPSEFIEAAGGVERVADATGPAPDVEGSQVGGDITVHIPSDPGPENLDPTDGWSVLGNSIQQALTHRSLTQYRRNVETGDMELVPDLATDLGTSNDDFTEWTFTIRDDAKWENGKPITAEEVKFGIERSFDVENFPGTPGQEYSVKNIDCGEGYSGPYGGGGGDCPGITTEGQDITIKMTRPFPDMDFWGSFMAMGPIPLEGSEPPAYGAKPLSNGPYKITEFRPNETLILEKNPEWVPESDPARHQYADSWTFKFDADQEKVDAILLSDSAESQTAVTNRVGSTNVTKAQKALGDNFLQQTGQCVSYLAPDYTKITDIKIRKAIAYAFDYQNIWLAGGQVPNVTRIPASTIMPPGMSGRKEYQPDGEQFTFDPAKAKELLKEAGAEGYKLTFIYDDSAPELVDANDQQVKGYKEAGFEVEAIAYQEDPYELFGNANNPINKKLNVRTVNWCSDWPSAYTMLPPLVGKGSQYNTAFFEEQDVEDRMAEIPTLPLEEQAAAWGDLDEEIGTKYLPIIPTAYRNDLFGAGSKIGGFTGDAAMSAINYRDLYVKK